MLKDDSMTEKLILAIDHGTSGMKVALITLNGKVIGWENESVKLILTPDGGAEQSTADWWSAFLSATKRLLARNLAPASAIEAICCSTQGASTVAVDREGNALRNAILWMDMRSAPYLLKKYKGLINFNGVSLYKTARWVAITGGMPSVTGKDPAGHMLMIKEKFPEVYERAYKFLNVLDYMNLRLTGRFVATYDSILTTWVTDNRKPDGVRYHETLIRDSGIDADKFPEIVSGTSVIGRLKADVAEALGLSRDVKVVAGAIDITAAAIGAGTTEDYQPHIYIGTSSWIAAHVPYKKTDIISSIASVPCAIPKRYLLNAIQETGGGNLTFLRDNIIYHKDELLQEAHVPDIFAYLDQIAERVPAGSHGVIYTPWIWGERAPIDDKNVRAGLYNINLKSTREDILRAFLEGIAFNTNWLLSPVESFLGRKVQSLNIIGGGAQSDVWCQIFADVMNVEIKQVADPIYANARGAAWIGAVGLGEIAFSDVPKLVEIKKSYTPNPNHRKIYDERFAIYKDIYKQMKNIYGKLNG
jgi:xylulokinase